jgi:hypothetical protein
MDLLHEHRENYEKELNRKQKEVIRLNELLGKWVFKYMELQENLSNADKPLSSVYYDEIQDLVYETVHAPSKTIFESQMTPRSKPFVALQKFENIAGDLNPPI